MYSMKSRMSIPVRSTLKCLRVFGMGLAVLLLCLPLFSQTYTGRILGSVRDQSGGFVAGATVVITDTQRGTTRTLVTDEAGDYVAADLAPGIYKVRAEAKGFKNVERPNIQLEVAKDVRIDFALAPGATSETITVTEEAPLVETTNDVLGGTLSNKTINDLPLNGRDFVNLVVLRPGLTRYPGGGMYSVTSNGLRAEDNNFVLDGMDNNDPYNGVNATNEEGVTGSPATHLPIDAIQEFNVQENPTAEYGLKPGVVVNVGLKSGTNSLHGSAYYFGRNNAFDARNWFNTKPDQQKPLHLHQFGGTMGGPILKDKLFFFAAYEGLRTIVGNTSEVASPNTVSMPDAGNCPAPVTGDCANSIPDAIAGVQAAGLPVNALSLSLASLFPANDGSAGAGLLVMGFPNSSKEHDGLAKIDYHINERHTITGRYFIGDSTQLEQDAPVLVAAWLTQAVVRVQETGANWTWTPGNRWVNQAKFGYSRIKRVNGSADTGVKPAQITMGFTDPNVLAMPVIAIGGFLPFGGNASYQGTMPAETVHFGDNVSYTRGKHAFRFGGEARRGSAAQFKYRFGKGRIRFRDASGLTALENFFAGNVRDGRAFVGDPHRNLSWWSYAGFFQDDWRISPKLTLNFGLRYEVNSVLKDANNLLGNFDPTIGLVQVGQQVKSPYNGDHNNFAPRVGFAWDISGNGKNVIRAGGGVMYEAASMNLLVGYFGVTNGNTPGLTTIPTGAVGVLPGGGKIVAAAIDFKPAGGTNIRWVDSSTNVFSDAILSTVNCNATTPCDILGVDPNIRTPYVTSWNLTLQHAFTSNLSLEAGYIGNHGSKLYSVWDVNQVNPALDDGSEKFGRPYTYNCASPIGAGGASNTGPCFPFLRVVNELKNGFRSNYNGLQVTLTQRAYHGVSFLVGYTYSHSLDQASENRATQAENSLNPGADYGSGDNDLRHRLTMSLSYVLPGKKSWGQLLQGWQLNSIMTLQGGMPYPMIDGLTNGSDISATGGLNDRWDFIGNTSDFTARPAQAIPYFQPGTPPPLDPLGPTDPAFAINNSLCMAAANTPDLQDSLLSLGCFAMGNSVMIPPVAGTFGTAGRNIFRGPGFHNWDVSVSKNWKFAERLTVQFRTEFFNVLNHPNFANPWGVKGTYGLVDPSAPSTFGCACATPDVAQGNPVQGSGGPRAIQLGLKLVF